MLRGMYTAASGLVVASELQEQTAYNLSNTNQPGFRGRGIAFETFYLALGRATETLGARTAQAYHDFRPGPLQQTGHTYDLALSDPDRFFVLQGPNGPVYTRNGTFFRTAAGELVSQAGYALQGEGGPLAVPANATQVVVAGDGSVSADGAPVGNLRLVRFADPSKLTAAGPTLYTAPPEAGLADAPGRVLQGYREGSNVQPADAMVRLVVASRYYDAAQRALRTISESVQLNTRPQG